MLCLLCSKNASVPFLHQGEFRWVKCLSCNLLYIDPLPSIEQIKDIYQRDTGKTFNVQADMVEAFEKGLEARKRFRIISPYLQGKKVLEIGCGAGYLLSHLRACGYNVAGTELSPALIDYARKIRRLDVYHGDEEIPSGLDVILLFNVLSHLRDPILSMRRFNSMLKDRGHLILETGNLAELKEVHRVELNAPEHLYHFSQHSLQRLLDQTGFKLKHVFRASIKWQLYLLKIGQMFRPGKHKELPRALTHPTSLRSFLKRVSSYLLLWLRYDWGHWIASSKDYCTLIVVAEKRPNEYPLPHI
jgi:SAM-dependent methyltransferase